MPSRNPNPMSPAEMSRIKAEKHATAVSLSNQSAIEIDGSVIRLAIGKTGGADNVGWELHTPGRAPRFYGAKEQCLEALKINKVYNAN